jgi:hypothetical protein
MHADLHLEVLRIGLREYAEWLFCQQMIGGSVQLVLGGENNGW